MSVGDIESDSRGTAARYNSGKPQIDFIPLSMIAKSFESDVRNQPETMFSDVKSILYAIGIFQATGEEKYLDMALSSGSSYWRECANAFEYGARKYAKWNWVKGMQWSVPLGCIGRHSLDVFSGEERDKESGLLHVGHIMCNIVMLKAYLTGFPEGNDLPPKNFSVR